MISLREKDQIRHDLTKHMRSKILRNIEDYIDRCHESGIDQRDCITELMVFLSHFTASLAATQFNIDAKEFGRTMVVQFQKAQAEEEG